jgi:nuclear GTP-binding protein
VCKTAPIPGETKVWQYITLTRRIYLIDCPGVVPPNQNDTPEDILLRGVVRVENVEYPAQYIQALLDRCERRHVERTYDLKGFKDWEDFLEQLARKSGKLLKGGEADVDTVAKSVVNDFLRGRLPWFVAPPAKEGADADGKEEKGIEGRKGRLGEMSGLAGFKRKRDEDKAGKVDSAAEASVNSDELVEDEEDNDDDDVGSVSDSEEGEDFAGFEEGSEDEDEEEGGVVLPTSIGNLDAFAEGSDLDEEEDEESEGEDEAHDTHENKRRRQK